MNSEQHPATIRQNRGVMKVSFVRSHIEQRNRVTSLGRHLHQSAVSRREDNGPVRSPARGSGAAENVRQISYGRSSRADVGHLPHLFSNHISDVSTFG